jgi:hypothetical protein
MSMSSMLNDKIWHFKLSTFKMRTSLMHLL